MSANLVANVTVTGNLSVATTITVDTQTTSGFSVMNGIIPVSNVALGQGNTTTFVLTDGTVRVCGNNQFGQLGQNDVITRSTVVSVLGISSQAIAVACGDSHTAILMNDGTVRVCGRNDFGQLGQNDVINRSTVVSVLGISSQAIAVACGGRFTSILMNDGTVRVCGRNLDGQLGQNDLINRSTVVSVIGISSQAIAIASGGYFTAILMNDGTVRVCGLNNNGQLGQNDVITRSTVVSILGISSQAIAIACGRINTAVLLNNGTVSICGNNQYGQLGQNDVITRSTVVSILGISSQAIAIAYGGYHVSVLINDGTVRVCGRNDLGQLGQNNLINRSTVVSVLGISSQAIAVSCGTYHSSILMNNGTVRVCGFNSNGQLGQNDLVTRSTVVPLIAPSNQRCYTSGPNGAKPMVIGFGSIANGSFGIVMDDGTVRVCGNNSSGQLGQNDLVTRSTLVTIVGISSQAISISTGSDLIAILMNDGTVRVCGNNSNGQLGQNDIITRSTFVPMVGLSSQAIAVACGRSNIAVLLNDGRVLACGRNSNGELGQNDVITRSTLVPVLGISSQATAVRIYTHIAILMNDGTVRVGGENVGGCLGQNDLSDRSTVVPFLGISSQAIAVEIGSHTVILLNDGSVRVCGDNTNGQLGVGNKTDKSTAVPLTGVSTAQSIGAAYQTTFIILKNGTVLATGRNTSGALGLNDLANRSTLVPVLGISSQAIAVSAGQFVTAILLNDKTVRVTGQNGLGQLGLNDVVTRSTVVSVPGLSGPILNMGSLLLGLNPAGFTPQTYQLDLSTDKARKASTTTWSTGSDIRIKSEIQSANLARCSEIIDSLDLKYFSWTPDIITEDRHSLGWIAQEVEQIFPKSVATSEAHGIPDFKNLNSDQLIKAMYGALKNMIQQTYPPVEEVQVVNEEQTDPPVEEVQVAVTEEQTDPPMEAVDASNTQA